MFFGVRRSKLARASGVAFEVLTYTFKSSPEISLITGGQFLMYILALEGVDITR